MAALGPLPAPPQLAVAVSGGADSTALALLARDWVQERGGRLLALVVDHGLRPESAAEAAATVARLVRLGIATERLRWEGDKPKTRIQERAREARYRLLLAACRRHHLPVLLLGHRLEDQAETVAMRQAHGSGLLGLAGMPAVSEREGVRLLRPLLAFPRARIEATLRARGVDWIEDPSNLDPRFARARLRRQGIDVRGWIARAEAARSRRAEIEARLARAVLELVSCHQDLGCARLALAGFARLDDELRALLLMRLLAHVGGGRYPPRRRVVAALLARLDGGMRRLTAGRCLLLREGGHLWVVRERRGLPPPQPLAPGEEILWDGRFLLHNRAPAPLTLLSLGQLAEALRRVVARMPAVPREALATLPAVAPEGVPAPMLARDVLTCTFTPRIPLAFRGFERSIVSLPGVPN